MKRTLLRWVRRLLVLSACAGLLVALAHAPWVRGVVLARLMSRISAATGFVFSASGLDYNLLAFTATVQDLRISRPGKEAAPILRVQRVRIDLTRRTLSGSLDADRVDAEGLFLVIDLRKSPGTTSSGPAAPFTVPGFTIRRAMLRRANIEVIDPEGLGHLTVRDATLELAGGAARRLEGLVTVAGGLTLDNADTHAKIDRLDSRAFLDGNTIGVRPASAVAGGRRVNLNGSITLTGPSPAFDLGVSGELDAALFASWFPAIPAGRGFLRASGRVTGPLNDPACRLSASTAGIALPDLRVPASTAAAVVSRAGIQVERWRAGIGSGRIEAAGRLPFGVADPFSRFSLAWTNVSAADFARVFPLAPRGSGAVRASGSARLQWPGMVFDFATVSGDIVADVHLAPSLPAAQVVMAGSAGRWTVSGTQELDGETRITLDTSVDLDPARLANSRVAGSLHLFASNIVPALARVREAFPAAPDVSANLLDTPLTFDGAIDGTAGMPRLAGTAVSDQLRVRGLPAMKAAGALSLDSTGLTVSNATAEDGGGNRVDGRGNVDFGAATTAGAFAASVMHPGLLLESWLRSAGNDEREQPWKVSGALDVRGTWTGTLADPDVSAQANGTDITLDGPAFAVERTTMEGRFEGLVSNPGASLRVTSPALRAGSMAPTEGSAAVTLEGGRARLTASVPEWSASLNANVATTAPFPYDATLSLSALQVDRLRTLAGTAGADWQATGTVSARIDAAGTLDARTVKVGGNAGFRGIGVGVDDSPLVDDLDAALEVRDGRLWLTTLNGRSFGGRVAASGDLPLTWLEDYLPEGWRLAAGTASSGPAAFEVRAEPDTAALMSWLRPESSQNTSGTLRVRANGEAASPRAESLQGRIVVEPATVTIRDVPFSMPRPAEVVVRNGRATLERAALTAPGTSAEVSGSLNLVGDRALAGQLSASGALGFLSSVVPGRVGGSFNATVRAAGTSAHPTWDGRLVLDNAAWVLRQPRIALRDWSGSAVITPDGVEIQDLRGHVNGGDALVTGTLPFAGRRGAGVTIQARDVFAEIVKGFRTQADADLTLAAAGEGSMLSGKVTVTSGAYREPLTAMARLFAAAPVPAAAPAAESPWLDSIRLDVTLASSAPIIIENSAGRLDLAASVKLQGTAAAPRLFGSLDMVDEGRLTLAGRTFRLNEGRVVFPGSGEDPAVQLIGETRVGDYNVTLRTQGPVSRLEINYSSDPPLSERDVQSLLVTGRTADVSGTKSGADDQFVLGTASSDLLGVAGQMVGLDTVQLGRGDFELGSSDVNPAMRLTVSKAVSARTRLVLSQNLDDNKLTWIVIFVPGRGYEVRLSQRDNLEEVVEFRQEISFGPGVSPPSLPGSRRRQKAPRVASVELAGVPGFPESDLESVLKLKASKAFDAGVWQDDRARLEAFYRDRGYAVARVVPERTVEREPSGERVRLTYHLDPGPRTLLVVRGIDVADADRRALMRVWSRSVLPEFLKDDLAGRLREQLATQGFLRPSIDVAIESSRPDLVTANVAVTPGPLTRVRRLVFEGATAISDADLRAGLAARVAVDGAWVDPGPLTEAVASLYAERGYPSARAAAQPLAFDGDAAELRVRVTEGPQSVLKEIVTTGVADERTADARKAVGIETGQPVLPSSEKDARGRLERFYADRGFRSATVRSRRRTDPEGRVALEFAVVEGPVSIVHAVAVKGLEATKPSVASGAITLKPGKPAGQENVAETRRRLYGLGLFRSVDVTSEPASAAAPPAGAASTPVNVSVSLEEARRFQLRYGVQLSNEYGPILEDFTSAIGVAGDIRDRNFLGRGFTLGASGRLEKNLQSLRWQFSLPTFLDQRLRTNLFATIRSETDASDADVTYTDKERDVTFEQRLRLPRHMEVSWGYSYNVRDVAITTQARTSVAELNGALGTLNGTFIFDNRDKPFDASRGWFQSSNLQWGTRVLGSDFDYVRVLLRQFYYKPAGPFVLASGVRWGLLHGISGAPPVTIIDRFFDAGGAQTVRGYEEDSLSAIDILGVPVGGTKVLLLNQEVRFRLFSRWLQGAVFVDAGNTFAPGDSVALDKLAVGAGFGIRIMTPFAPLRIDVGYPLDRRPGDNSYKLHFSIGQIF